MKLNIAVVDDIEHDRKVVRDSLDRFFSVRLSFTVRTVNHSSAKDFLKACNVCNCYPTIDAGCSVITGEFSYEKYTVTVSK